MPHEIDVFIDQRPYRIAQGKYTGSQLKGIASVPPGNLLFRVDGPNRQEIGDSEEVEVHPNEHFVSAPPVGGASSR